MPVSLPGEQSQPAEFDPAERRFVHDSDVQAWLQQLARLEGAARRCSQVQIAWHLRQRDSHRALALVEEVEAALAGTDYRDDLLRARLALVRSEVHWLFANLDRALSDFDQAMELFAACGDARGLSDAHWLRAWIAVDQGDTDRRDRELAASATAASAASDGLRAELAEAAMARCAVFRDLQNAIDCWGPRFLERGSGGDPSLMVWVEDFRALVASKSQRIAVAVAHGVRMYESALRTGQTQRAVTAATNIGFDLTRLNDHQSALEWMQRGLDLARSRGWPASLGVCLSETAETLRQLDRLDAAEALLGEALAVLAPLGRSRWRALVFNYLGDIALDRGEHASALQQFDRLAELALLLDQADLQGIAARGRAHALSGLNRPEEALAAARTALAMSTAQGDGYNQIAALRVMSSIHSRQSPAQQGLALQLIEQALAVARNIEGFITPPELLESAARGQAAKGDFEAAYMLTSDAIAARERIHSEQATQRAVAMQIRRETEVVRAEAEQHRELAEAEARRARALQETTDTLEKLGAIGQAITATLSMDAVLKLLAAQIRELLDADSFGIYLLESKGEALDAALLIERGQALPGDRIPLDSKLRHAARCARERREFVLQRQAVDDDPSHLPGSLATLSAMYAPLLIGDRLLGVMTVQSLRTAAYGGREQLIFRSLAAYGAIALDNAAAYSELELAHRELAGLSELSSRLQSCVDAADAYRCLGRAAMRLFPGSCGALYLRAEEGEALVAEVDWGGHPPSFCSSADQTHCAALREGRAVWHPVGLLDPCCRLPAACAKQTARACLPMAAEGGQVFGALVLEFASGKDAIGTDRRYPLALALAEQTALALSNLRLREALQQQSIRDGLTGVFNRRHLDASLARELNRCRAHGLSLAIAMIDIDHFKPINDRYGHAAGDHAIRMVAEAIQTSFRSGDEVCRYGGEEFVVLLADTSEAVVLERAETLRATLRDLQISHADAVIGALTVSIGVAFFPRHGNEVDVLLGAADVALYAAKQGGRDQVVLASP